jgi:hypothetical protein
MTDEELIARLRLYGSKFHHEFGHNAAADRIEALTAKLAKAVEALDRLARLGNGDRYGNSEGNVIAQTTLAEIKGESYE